VCACESVNEFWFACVCVCVGVRVCLCKYVCMCVCFCAGALNPHPTQQQNLCYLYHVDKCVICRVCRYVPRDIYIYIYIYIYICLYIYVSNTHTRDISTHPTDNTLIYMNKQEQGLQWILQCQRVYNLHSCLDWGIYSYEYIHVHTSV